MQTKIAISAEPGKSRLMQDGVNYFRLLAIVTNPMSSSAKHVILSVVSDLVSDQRVHRTALALHRKGLKVTLIGRERKASPKMDDRAYTTVRFRLLWEKGPLFYASFNIRLLFYLIFHKADVLVANDLDTLPANFIASKLKGSTLYYDSHEYFTEVPELVNRPRVQSIWKRIEKWILPKIHHMYTVNESIAGLYSQEYKIPVAVVRNVPFRRHQNQSVPNRASLGLPADKKIFIFQGAGINVQRGAEEVIEAMQFTTDLILLFVGTGDVIDFLKSEQKRLHLESKVVFVPRQSMEKLREYTLNSDFGISIDKDTNLNYRYSLPNKLFDYIQAEIPVFVSDLPEVRKIVEKYDIGVISNSHDPGTLATLMMKMAGDEFRLAQWKENLKLAAADLCWENEEQKLLEIFKDVC